MIEWAWPRNKNRESLKWAEQMYQCLIRWTERWIYVPYDTYVYGYGLGIRNHKLNHNSFETLLFSLLYYLLIFFLWPPQQTNLIQSIEPSLDFRWKIETNWSYTQRHTHTHIFEEKKTYCPRETEIFSVIDIFVTFRAFFHEEESMIWWCVEEINSTFDRSNHFSCWINRSISSKKINRYFENVVNLSILVRSANILPQGNSFMLRFDLQCHMYIIYTLLSLCLYRNFEYFTHIHMLAQFALSIHRFNI